MGMSIRPRVIAAAAFVAFLHACAMPGKAPPGLVIGDWKVQPQDVASVETRIACRSGQPVVAISLSPAGAHQLADITRAPRGGLLDVSFDGDRLSSSLLHGPIEDGELLLTEVGKRSDVEETVRLMQRTLQVAALPTRECAERGFDAGR